MAFDPDAYLAAKKAPAAPAGGGFDPDAYLAAKAGPTLNGHAKLPDAARPAQPRERSDEELGLDAGPQFSPDILGRPRTTSPVYPARPEVPTDLTPGMHTRPADPMEADPIAQGVATSAVLGPVGKVVGAAVKPVLGAATAPAIGAAEGAAASKSMGGSALAGAALGGVFGAIGGAAKGLTPEAAGARGVARLEKDITKGVPGSKATARLTNDVKFQGADKIADVAKDLPRVDKALRTQARSNPGAAHAVVDETVTHLTDKNSADFAAMQRQHGGVPLQPMAERLAALQERLNQQGRGVEADAVNRVTTDLLRRYGSGEAGLAEAKLTMSQIRNIRNDMGTVADPARNIKPNTRRQALSKVYAILNKEIEDVAANTRGVDVEALAARNRQISTLIPIRDTLAERAAKLADKDAPGLIQRAKQAPGRAVDRLKREADYAISRIPVRGELAGPELPASVPVAAREQERNRVLEMQLQALGAH